MTPQPTPPAQNNPSNNPLPHREKSNVFNNETTPLSLGEGLGVRTKDKLLKQIINYLRLNHALESAFLLSKQTHTQQTNYNFPPSTTSQTRTFTYTLVILTPPLLGRGGRGVRTHQPNPAQIMDELYNHTQKKAKAYIIPFTKKAAVEQYDWGEAFITHICDHTPCLYTNDPFWQKYKTFKPGYDKETYNKIQKEWKTRFNRANYLHNLTVYNEMEQDPVAYFDMLHRALQQTCLGLIYVFWAYKPPYMALPYLLHLCSLFAQFPTKIFNTTTFQNHQIHHLLCQAPHNLIYKTRHHITQNQIDKAWKKCDTFLQESNNLVTNHLQMAQ